MLGVLAVPVLCLLAVILGIIALFKIKRATSILKGKILAIIGIIIGGGAPLVFIALLTLSSYVSSPAITSGGRGTEVFDSSQYQGAMGKIILPYKGESLLVLIRKKDEDKRIRLFTTDGIFMVPVGTFSLSQYDIFAKDDNIKWTASGSLRLRKLYQISADTPLELEIGPPFTASIFIKEGEQNEVKLHFELIGRGGNRFIIRNSEPSFHMIAHTGSTLWQGKFKYG
ncbi:hypothetical protein ACFL5I_01670 [Planctomycetota bacterium]